MYKKYIYSHTIQKDQQRQTINVQQKQSIQSNEQKIEEQASDDMEDLFKIGHKKIVSSKARDAQSPIIKQKKIKKQKKQKKDKNKKQKKQKKEKKQKKKNKYGESYCDDNDTPQLRIQAAKVKQQQYIIQNDAMQKLQHKMKLLSKYQKQLSAYRTKEEQQNILNQQFGLKQKLTDTTLTLDIIKFGMPEIQKYGLQDRQVPFYKRHHKMNTIIGMRKKKKKIDKLIKQLNLITNQVGVNWNNYQNTSLQRYYHFVGYQKLKGECPQKYQVKNTNQELETNQNRLTLSLKKNGLPNNQIKPSILYNPPTQMIVKLLNNQQKLRSINKQYNTALNANPKDIGLWLKFLDIQDKVSQLTLANSDFQQSMLQKNALIQRKVAIATKALQKNPFDQILGIKYVQFLIAAKKDRRLIQQNIKGLLQVHADSEQLWRFYLQFKLSSIVDFKHSHLQKQFEQINSYLFEKRINQVKSGKQVWKIRKCGLVILEQVLKIHKLEGYYELSTAICCALLQFNIFCSKQMLQLDRNSRIEYFKSYWQDYSNYKLGEYFNIGIFLQNTQLNYITHTWEGYQAFKSSQLKSQNNNKQKQGQFRQKYIGTIFKQNLKQAKRRSKRWIPTQTLHDSQQIQKLPETFVMFQDIQIYLQIYRNTQNLQFLCNIAVSNLNMPIIFTLSSTNNSQSQYLIQWMANTIMNPRSSVSPYCQHSCLHWSRYWHPILTQQFIGVKNNNIDQLNKFIYTVNLVQCLYFKLQKLLSFIELTQMRQYLMFLYGTIYYLHASTLNKQNGRKKIQNLLKLFPESVCLSRIKNLLISDSVNINLWSMYIEYESYAGKPIEQCINCYLDCISAIDNSYIYLQQQVQIQKIQLQKTVKKLNVLYWLSQFMYRCGITIANNNKPTNDRIVFFTLLKQLLLENSKKSLTFIQLLQNQANIQPMEKLLIGNKLMSLLKCMSQNENNKRQICVIYYMLLQIGQVPSTIIPLLLNINTNLSISILIDFGLISYVNFIDFNLMTTKMCDLKVVTYFARSFRAHSKGIITGFYSTWFRECCCTFRKMLSTSINKEQKDYYEQQQKDKLFLWLLLMRILQPEQRQISNQNSKNKQFPQNYINFIQYFLRIAENNLTNTHEPLCMQLLNNLLNKPQFAYSCLNQFPYIRQMYSTASLIVENAQRIQKLVMEKQIRMNYSKINQQYKNTYANRYIDLTEEMQ